MTLDVSKVSFWSGRRALRLAVSGGSTEEIASLLTKEAGDLMYSSCDDEHTHSALEVVASAGHLEAMERLLAAGADPNTELDERGMSALEAAAAQGQVAAVQKLLEKGAHPDHRYPYTGSPTTTPLIAATKAGHVEICKALLQAGADVSQVLSKSGDWRGISAIKAAAETSNITLLELFLRVVTDARAAAVRDPDDRRTAIDVALVASAKTGDVLAIQRLLDAGADVTYDAQYEAYEAITAAAGEGHLEAMNKLLQAASSQNKIPAYPITRAL